MPESQSRSGGVRQQRADVSRRRDAAGRARPRTRPEPARAARAVARRLGTGSHRTTSRPGPRSRSSRLTCCEDTLGPRHLPAAPVGRSTSPRYLPRPSASATTPQFGPVAVDASRRSGRAASWTFTWGFHRRQLPDGSAAADAVDSSHPSGAGRGGACTWSVRAIPGQRRSYSAHRARAQRRSPARTHGGVQRWRARHRAAGRAAQSTTVRAGTRTAHARQLIVDVAGRGCAAVEASSRIRVDRSNVRGRRTVTDGALRSGHARVSGSPCSSGRADMAQDRVGRAARRGCRASEVLALHGSARPAAGASA